MAHKIRVKAVKNEKKHSTLDIVAFILGILLLLAGPAIYRMGLVMNLIGELSFTLLIIGILAISIGLIFLLLSKLTNYNKLLASLLCFYAAINSFFLVELIEKLKLAAHNIMEASIEAGIQPSNPNMEANVAQMGIINEVSIMILAFLGVFLLILHIFRNKEETGLTPPEVPPDGYYAGE